MTDVIRYRQLFSKNYKELRNRAYRITCGDFMSDDVLHESYLRVEARALKNKLTDFQADDNFIAYMFFVIRGYWRRQLIKRSLFFEFIDHPCHTHYQEFFEKDLISAIESESNQRHKHVLKMLYDGFTFDEIAKRFNLTQVNCRSVIFEARKKLYERVTGESYKTAKIARRPDRILANGMVLRNYPQNTTMVNKILFLSSIGLNHEVMWPSIKENDISSPRFRTFHSSFHYLKNKGLLKLV